MTNEIRIIGLLIRDRIKEAGQTQKLLTNNAHLIRSRLGFHEVSERVCSRVGMVLLQLDGESQACDQFVASLKEIGGVEIQTMVFTL